MSSEIIDNIFNSEDIQEKPVANLDDFCDKACCISMKYEFDRRNQYFQDNIAMKISRMLDVLPGINAHTKIIHFYNPEELNIFDNETQRNVRLASLHSALGSTKFAFGFNENLKFKKDYQRLIYNLGKIALLLDLDKIEFIYNSHRFPIYFEDVTVLAYDAGFKKMYSIAERGYMFRKRDKVTDRLINMFRK